MTDYRLTDARISRWIDEESAGGFPVDLLEATFDRTRAILGGRGRRRRASSRRLDRFPP